MISKLAPVTPGSSAQGPSGPQPPAPPKDARLHQAAQEFEAMMLRQMLSAAKITGHSSEGGYDGMAIDALAGGISKTGGVGLAQKIEAALAGHAASPAAAAPALAPAPAPALTPTAAHAAAALTQGATEK